MTSQTINTIHTLFNISRSKVNQTSIFGQLTEYYSRNAFLNHSQDAVEKLVADPFIFFKHISGSTVANVINLLLLFVQVEVYQNIL